MQTILLFGASGPVGHFLLPELARFYRIIPISRSPRDGWLRADLSDRTIDWPLADAVISLGPLDVFSRWITHYPQIPLKRVIALSSMSAESKRDSIDDTERALAERLRTSETALKDAAAARGIALTIFRPTLIYGGGTDRSLAPIARWVRRWQLLPLPVGANGLRQPVHAADLAAACIGAWANPASYGKTYGLGGGERLSFNAMVLRIRAQYAPWSLPIPIPISLLRLASRRVDRMPIGTAAIGRLTISLTADNGPASRDFGYSPRPFVACEVLPAGM